MSSNTNTNSNTNNNSIRNVMLENLDLHIPKISAKTTADNIAYALWVMRIGTVEYVDIVAIKDPETKEVKHYSAFIKLQSWGPERFPANEFDEKKVFKIFLGAYSNEPAEKYWVLYPNKNPLPRTKVNIHQLAASNEKLFEVNEQLSQKVGEQEMIIKDLKAENTENKNKIDYLEKQIEMLIKMFGVKEQNLLPVPVLKRSTAIDNTWQDIFKKPEPLISDKSFKTVIVDEDDCMFSRPLVKPFPEIEPVVTSVSPVKQIDPVDEKQVREIIQNNSRAICSRDFCGNL